MRVRRARVGEMEQLRQIEIRAGERFRAIGMDAIADDQPSPTYVLDWYREEGRCWVAVDDVTHEEVVGYVLVDVVDGAAHIEQISVVPEASGLGMGRVLIDQVASWALERGMPVMTLTTFRDVPWNAPYYRRLGFDDMADDAIGPELRALVAREAENGLDPTTRVCMRRPL